MLPAILTAAEVNAVSPAFAHYTAGPLLSGLWKPPELSPRDRSMVTVAALIARIQTIEMPYHFALALDNGVESAELSEIITHLAFYAGWANAMSAVDVTKTSEGAGAARRATQFDRIERERLQMLRKCDRADSDLCHPRKVFAITMQ